MTLARKIGLTDHGWYTPTAFVLGSFAIGVQVALLFEAAGPPSYPPVGKEPLAWASLGLLALLALLHLPPEEDTLHRTRANLQRAWTKVTGPLSTLLARRQELVLEPVDQPDASPGGSNGTGAEAQAPVAQAAPRLKVRVHSPLAVGPVVAPEETLPIHVQAEPAELARELEVTFRVQETGTTRSTTTQMTGTDLVHTETFHDPGPLRVEVVVVHPQAQPARKVLEGRVATYREEVGRLFDELKATAMEAGMDVGPQSTPREVCQGLPALGNASYEDAEALRTHLEVALYGDDDVDRSTYEGIHTILAQTGLTREASA